MQATLPVAGLVAGANVIAVEMHQNLGTSSDLSFDLELIANTTTAVNALPTVALVSPLNGETFIAPANVTLTAAADRSGGLDCRQYQFRHAAADLPAAHDHTDRL